MAALSEFWAFAWSFLVFLYGGWVGGVSGWVMLGTANIGFQELVPSHFIPFRLVPSGCTVGSWELGNRNGLCVRYITSPTTA